MLINVRRRIEHEGIMQHPVSYHSIGNPVARIIFTDLVVDLVLIEIGNPYLGRFTFNDHNGVPIPVVNKDVDYLPHCSEFEVYLNANKSGRVASFIHKVPHKVLAYPFFGS